MKTATRKLRPPIKRHGGKAYLARRIVALMPEHRVYCEPFVGGGSVLLNKPPAEVEVAGDLDAGLVEVWWSLQCGGTAPFLGALGEIAYDEATFDEAGAWVKSPFGPQRAVGYLVRNRFSRGGLGKTFAWSERHRGGQPEQLNSWDTIRGDLPAIAERVRGVSFRRIEARKLIEATDGPDTLHYLDPPYLPETRTAKKAYGEFEMDAKDHARLLLAARECEGVVMISGYPSSLYGDLLMDWTRHDFSMPNHSGQGKTKQRRTECLWINRKEDQ